MFEMLRTANTWLLWGQYCPMCLLGVKRRTIGQPDTEDGDADHSGVDLKSQWGDLLRRADRAYLSCVLCKAPLYWPTETLLRRPDGTLVPCVQLGTRFYSRAPYGSPGIVLTDSGSVDWKAVTADASVRAVAAGISPWSSMESLETSSSDGDSGVPTEQGEDDLE